MGGTKPANLPGQSALPLSEDAAGDGTAVGPGLNTLIQGQHDDETPAPHQPRPPTAGAAAGWPSQTLTLTLLLADLVLILLSVWLVVERRGRLGFWETVLCVATLGLGAWLGCLAFLLRK